MGELGDNLTFTKLPQNFKNPNPNLNFKVVMAISSKTTQYWMGFDPLGLNPWLQSTNSWREKTNSISDCLWAVKTVTIQH